jgi:hypothetical protein
MKMYGNQNAITPFDSLAKKFGFHQSLAAGNRTVRGLEAVMLSSYCRRKCCKARRQ